MRALLFAIVIALTAPHAHADETSDVVTYRVKQGDSLALLAAEFYGDRNKALYIVAANKLDRPRPLKPGERLKIPVSRPYTTAPGDTFESIAASYLGNAKRATFLAEFNGVTAGERIPAGTELFIPFAITHRADGTESIAQVATAYFGGDKNASLIRKYNFLDGKEGLEKGDTIVVPIFNVRLQASKLPPADAESQKRRERQKKAQATAATALPVARLAWRDGDFALVKATLATIAPDVDYLQTPQATEVGVLVGALHVAYGEPDKAKAAFAQVLERKPGHALSPYYFSPTVLAVWKSAGGAFAGEAP